MATTTFCRSNSAKDSYSMLTKDSPPEMEGQQLMDSGTRLSSLVCATPTKTVTHKFAPHSSILNLPSCMLHRRCIAISVVGSS